jgi:hypothetical protein
MTTSETAVNNNQNDEFAKRIKLIASQSVMSTLRILNYCDASEKIGIDTAQKLDDQYEKIKNINNQLEKMDNTMNTVEKNLKELKKSKFRAFLEEFCCCCCIRFKTRANSSSSSMFYSIGSNRNHKMRKIRKKVIYDSECSLKSTPTQIINASKSETYISQVSKPRKIKNKTTSLGNLRSATSVSRSIKSIWSSVKASSIKLVKSSASMLSSSKNKVTNVNSLTEMEKNLNLNMKNIDMQLNSLQAMSLEISKKIEIKDGYLSDVNRYAEVNIERVKDADSVGRRLLHKKNK